ncbi:MAG: hypothetical protein ACTHJL_05885 [Amnibacterium sp.]
MAWVVKLHRGSGDDAVLGFHPSRLAAMRQAHEFNRRYQTEAAVVEEFDASREPWPGATR